MRRRLGVNIDHIATLREARKIRDPDPLEALPILKDLGVDQITCHLREDRRHIQDHDLVRILKANLLPVNLEMAATPEMQGIALRSKPATCTLVPEKRLEITTEGGLDLTVNTSYLAKLVAVLQGEGIRVSLFIDPDFTQIQLAHDLRATAIELHTGTYCESWGENRELFEWDRLKNASVLAHQKGLKVYAGHGLNALNLIRVVQIQEIEEYNIGHSIIGRAVFVGLSQAVKEIQSILNQ